jgi:hypothetical protein
MKKEDREEIEEERKGKVKSKARTGKAPYTACDPFLRTLSAELPYVGTPYMASYLASEKC